MTVKELRDLLAAFEDDARVLVSGYEDGYDDPAKIKLVNVADRGEASKAEAWWSGRYEEPWSESGTTFYAVVIPR